MNPHSQTLVQQPTVLHNHAWYDAWGNTDASVPAPQLGTENKLRYTGEALDPGTQLYYLGARYYDPSVGRFVTRDPLPASPHSSRSANRFSYAFNIPVNYKDPSGLSSVPNSTSAVLDSWTANLLSANISQSFAGPTRTSALSLSGMPQTYLTAPSPPTDEQRIQKRWQELQQQDQTLNQCTNAGCVISSRYSLSATRTSRRHATLRAVLYRLSYNYKRNEYRTCEIPRCGYLRESARRCSIGRLL